MFAVENSLVCVHLSWHCCLQETFPLAKFEYRGHTSLLAASVTMHFEWVCNLSNSNNQLKNIARVFKVVCLFDIPSTCIIIFSSADNVSSAELMVLLIVRRPSSVVVRRRLSSSVVVRRPSVNFCFKSLLLLQFLFDNSEFFTGETRHIVPPCNKAGISNFCLEFQKLQKFQISWKHYSSYSSYSIILNFLLEKLGI